MGMVAMADMVATAGMEATAATVGMADMEGTAAMAVRIRITPLTAPCRKSLPMRRNCPLPTISSLRAKPTSKPAVIKRR